MSKFMALAACGLLLGFVNQSSAEDKAAKKVPAALNFQMESLTGSDVDLGKYAGKVVLIVNTASACGATPQYEQLQALHKKYEKDGLAVLGFPCNQFGAQEPGTATEIASFCKENYGVTFDMFGKIEVNGDKQCSLFKYLTSKDTNAKFAGPIKWNFEKFLLNRNGEVIARFATGVKPDAPEVTKAIEAELAKK